MFQKATDKPIAQPNNKSNKNLDSIQKSLEDLKKGVSSLKGTADKFSKLSKK